MTTMRTLSITMLLAGCGLQATDTGLTESTATSLGEFVIVENYQGRSDESAFGSNERVEEYHDEPDTESLDEFFEGFEYYFDPDIKQQNKPSPSEPKEMVLEQNSSNVPTFIAIGALVGVGYVVYKYATKKESKKVKEKSVEAVKNE